MGFAEAPAVGCAWPTWYDLLWIARFLLQIASLRESGAGTRADRPTMKKAASISTAGRGVSQAQTELQTCGIPVGVRDDDGCSSSRRTRTIAVVWLSVVILSVIWQPFVLGFYMDDWSVNVECAHHGLAFSTERYGCMFAVDPLRPGLIPLRYLLSSLFSDLPILWQGAILLAKCSIGYLAGLLIYTLCDWKSLTSRLVACSAGLCWGLFPWNAAATFWPTMLPITLLMAVYAGVCILTIEYWRRLKSGALLAGLVSLWLCVSYEAFYFQWVSIVLFGLVLIRSGRARLREVGITAGALVGAQGLAVIWFAVSRRFGYNTVKEVQPGWFARVVDGLSRLPSALLGSMGGLKYIFGTAVAIAFVIAAFVYWRSLTDALKREAAARCLFFTLISLACGLASIVVFCLGGRLVTSLGVETRVFFVFSFWLAVAGGVTLLHTLHQLSNRLLKTVFSTAVLCIGGCLVAGQVKLAGDWATSWRMQQRILAEAPVSEMKKTEPDASILLVSPLDFNGAPIFCAPWDLNNAMPLTYPVLQGRTFVVYSRWGGPMEGDQKTLGYTGQPPLANGPAVYVWRPLERSFWKPAGHFTVHQDLSITAVP